MKQQRYRIEHAKRGASATGYGLVVGLISIVALGAITGTGAKVDTLFGSVSSKMEAVATNSSLPLASPSASASSSPVNAAVTGALSTGDPGRYDDGSYAISCLDYLNGSSGYDAAAGGDGVYEIDTDGKGGNASFIVYCDMITDGGGWTRVAYANNNAEANSTGAMGTTTQLATKSVNTPSKLDDAVIRDLALSGNGEYSTRNTIETNIYVQRPVGTTFSTYSTTGWANQIYEAKNNSGTWVASCNGHYNNRGFSSYSDASGSACTIIFQGGSFYATMNHTSFTSSPSHNLTAYVR